MIAFLDQLMESKVRLPKWTQGVWSSVGASNVNSNQVHINQTQLVITAEDDQMIKYDLKFFKVMLNRGNYGNSVRIRGRSFDQW